MLRIFLPLYLLLFFFSFYADELFDQLLIIATPDAVVDDTVGDLAGAFYMVEEILRLTPESEWPDRLAKMSSVNIPIQLVDQTNLTLSEEGIGVLDEGGIWVANIEQDLVLKAFGSQGQFIQIGPIGTTDLYDQSVLITVFGGSSLLVICVVLWSLTVQRRIGHLTKVAQRLGEGDLGVRASEKGHLQISHLNHDFNTMADRIQQLIESHKHLSNAVSHELRTPISRIKFELDYAQDLEEPTEMKLSLDSIAEDVIELEELVSEALTYARFERANLPLEYASHNLQRWLSQWQEEIKLPQDISLIIELPDSSCLVENSCQANSPYQVDFNASSLKRVLDNLVLNASRYANAQIRIILVEHTDTVELVMDDDGSGIPKECWDTLFDPFVRADQSRSRNTGGFGLGLAIVKQIMLRHNGSVKIDDSPLGGARFILRWPKRQK